VWVDALTNYITAAGFPDENAEKWRYWPAIHIIGKDIVRFHAVYWPAFLMSAGVALPQRVFAHGFLNNKGEKMSKSVGNVIDPFALIAEYGLDQVRYFFMREVPFGQDGAYSHEAIVTRTNADLANGLGNLAQRTLSMIAKNCEGRVPDPGVMTADDLALIDAAAPALAAARGAIAGQQIHRALEAIFEMVSSGDKYVDTQAPWALKKNNPARMATVLFTVAETLRRIALMTQAFMPASSARLLDLLGVSPGNRTFADFENALAPGTALPEPQGIFPRYVEKAP
jgi:methionyl-tRNA synthetase